MINPISLFFTLASERARMQRALALYEQIKDPLTELIDIGRDLGAKTGLLGAEQPQSAGSAALAMYTTERAQQYLNDLMGAGLSPGEPYTEGSRTETAVKQFQKKYPPLRVDGKLGVQTWAVLVTERGKLGG